MRQGDDKEDEEAKEKPTEVRDHTPHTPDIIRHRQTQRAQGGEKGGRSVRVTERERVFPQERIRLDTHTQHVPNTHVRGVHVFPSSPVSASVCCLGL